MNVAQNIVDKTADGINNPRDQSKVLKFSSEAPGSAILQYGMAQGVNHRQVEEINLLVKKVEDLDIKRIERKKEMREGNNQIRSLGSLRLELSGEIEATSEDPNTVPDATYGESAVAPRPGMLETMPTTHEAEDAKVDICILKADDLYSAD